MKKRFLNFAVFVLFISPAFGSDGKEEKFSWRALLGASTENATAEISNHALCNSAATKFDRNMSSYFDSMRYHVRHPIPPDKAKLNEWNWHDPVGGYTVYVEDKDYPSSVIRELSCATGLGQSITILSFEGKVFDITIDYNFCSDPLRGCGERKHSPADKVFEAQLNGDVVPFPDYVNGGGNTSERFERKYGNLLSDRLLRKLLRNDTEACQGIGKRCIVVNAGVDDGIYHSVIMLETFERGLFGDKNVERFADKQRFTLIQTYKNGWAAFASEVAALTQIQMKIDQGRNEKENRREKAIESTE